MALPNTLAADVRHPVADSAVTEAAGRVLRAGRVMDAGRLGAAQDGDVAELRLFDDVQITVRINRVAERGGGDFDAFGSVLGVEHSRVTLVRRSAVLVGAIHAPPLGDFDLRTAADGSLLTREFASEGPPQDYCGGATPELLANPERGEVPLCPTAGTPLAGYACDDGATVDAMVVYTAAARDAAGGVAQIEALIDLATAIANQAFADSLIGVEVRIVRKALIAYAETGDYSIDLPRLTETADGFLDSVHAERDTYGADLVYLWVNSLNSGGAAFSLFTLFPNDDGRFGFGVMRQDNAAFETFAHELGHNFGCAHDRDNAPEGAGFYNYSYGYREPGGVWKTIMAYPPGTTVYNFSNPHQGYNGPLGNPGPLGVPGDDPNSSCNNTLTINSTRFTVANFRPSTLPAPPPARLYVRPDAPPGGDGASWATAMQEVQTALCTATRSRGAVSEIWVAAGAYLPDGGSGDRLRSFRLADGVTLYGGFAGTETLLSQRDVTANVCTLSGDIGAPGSVDNCYHVLDVDDLGPTAVLDGFTVADGAADQPGWPHDAGAGVRARCSAATFRNCRFADHVATYGGGAAAIEDESAVTFESCVFSLNAVGTAGGAVLCYATSPSFNDCRFEFNGAEFGGAVSNTGGSPSFTDCEFVLNGAGTGGAVDNNFGGAPTFDGCRFEQNDADWAGGVSNYFASASLTQCDFIENVSFNGGGAMMNGEDGQVLIDRGYFEDNDAVFGGALYSYNGSDATLLDCEFTLNAADDGGAVYHFDDSPTYRRCVFTQNSVVWSGGASVSNGGAPAFVACEFTANDATYGGAAATWAASLTAFVNCGFFGNMAQWSGGAVENSAGAPTFTNCVLSANVASDSHGGGLSNVGGGSATLSNCTLAGNHAGFAGGGIASDPPHVTLNNSILWGNTHTQAPGELAQLYHFANPFSAIQSSTLHGWSGAYGGTANNGLDPLLADPDGADNVAGTSDDDLSLAGGSPAIDAGNNSLVPADAADADEDGNVAEATPLDQAGAARFVDVPAAPDTGVGAPPLVDRGALEAAVAACLGDLDGDDVIGLSDLAILLANFGTVGGATPEQGDLDGDMDVDITDVALILSVFGSSCG